MVEGRKGMKPHKSYGNEEFTCAIVKVAIAQICGAKGFQAFQKSALENLFDIAVQYITNVGKVAMMRLSIDILPLGYPSFRILKAMMITEIMTCCPSH